jgi:hypothetical protein
MLLMTMAAVVMADGVATKAERKLLKTAARRWGIPYNTVNPVLFGQMDAAQIESMRPVNPPAFIDGLIGAALIEALTIYALVIGILLMGKIPAPEQALEVLKALQ